jgi:predicted nucleotidyltransferase component of viral defense system
MVLRQEGRVVNPVLTPFQEDLLRAIAGTEIGEAFFLTGGTALAAFHLHHRRSEDLDFGDFPGTPLFCGSGFWYHT